MNKYKIDLESMNWECLLSVFNGMPEIFEPGNGVFIPPGEEHKHIGQALTDKAKLIFVEAVAK